MLDNETPMDDFTERHLKTWLEATVLPDEREQVEVLIKDFVGKHPEVITRGDSWPEIRTLAERKL